MKRYFILFLAICCLSNTRYLSVPEIPSMSNQIVQASYVAIGKRPPPVNGDICRKWINQQSINVFDGKNWHYHPAQTVCYMRESQARH